MAAKPSTERTGELEHLTQTAAISPIAFEPRLVQLGGGARGEVGRVVLLNRDRVVIGRGAEGVHFVVADGGISRRHAAVERTADGFRVVDFGSRNGTFVNNVKVKSAELRDGDRIQLGATTLLRFTNAGADEEWLRQSLDHGGVALWDYNVASREAVWSEHADRVLQLTAGTLSQKRLRFDSLVHGDDLARVQAALERAVQGEPFEQEFRLVAAPQSLRWVLCRAHLLRSGDGAPERLSGTTIDVSERKLREVELRRMAVMFESLSDGVFLTDRSGAVVDLNSAASVLFGVEKQKALGARLLELINAPNPIELEAQAQSELMVQRKWTAELALSGSGGDRFFEVVAFPLNGDDQALGTAFLFRDVTERKRLQSQVAFFDRLSSLGTLSAGIAHEINNPLSFVLGSLEFVKSELRERQGAFHQELEALQDALDGAHRIANTVRDMKTFSRDDASTRPVATDPRGPLEMAFKMTHKLLSARAALTHELDDAVPRVLATESRLSQVFINLLVNAAQAIPDGKQGHVRVVQRVEGDFVVTEVSDDGVGVPPEQLGRIFDPFFTTKPVGVGTGLGLSICHGLVTGFGGQLSVESEVGRGTTFTVRLPISREVEYTASVTPLVLGQRRARLLLIDDEPLVLRSLARNLSSHHDVTTALGVEEALELLEDADFDVILCDLMMPGRTGMDLFEHLETERPELAARVVFVSGGAFTERASKFLAEVPNLTLTKPLDARELASAIQSMLRERTGIIRTAHG